MAQEGLFIGEIMEGARSGAEKAAGWRRQWGRQSPFLRLEAAKVCFLLCVRILPALQHLGEPCPIELGDVQESKISFYFFANIPFLTRNQPALGRKR